MKAYSIFGSHLMDQATTPNVPCRTSCTCDNPGQCDRHNLKKPVGWWTLCRTNARFVQAWDEGTGPGQRKERNQEPMVLKARDNTAEVWRLLHSYAVDHQSDWDPKAAKRWYCREWLKKVPNYGCSCKRNWIELTKRFPPDFTSPQSFFDWSWARHNDVSTHHSKKPTITLDDAYAIFWVQSSQ